jgi:8-oxo-dGTP pyrophosphatase MutT (NUDIX family)
VSVRGHDVGAGGGVAGAGGEGGAAAAAAWAEALRAALAARAEARRVLEVPGFRAAAVLVPLLVRGEPYVVLTQRVSALPTHGGQVAFPGGGVEEGDADRVATALRESHEELGLAPADVTPLGLLDDQITPSRFVITPVVALVRAGAPPFRPNPGEVAEAFDVPVGVLRDPARCVLQGTRTLQGLTFELWAYRPPGHEIWGATARVLHELLPLLPPWPLVAAAPPP